METSPPPNRSRAWRDNQVRWVVVGVAVATAGFFVVGMPWLGESRGWFYRPSDKHIGGLLYVMAAGALLPWIAARALDASRAGRRGRALALLFSFAVAIQLAFSLVPGDGLAEVWERHQQGHGQFFAIAHRRADAPAETIRDYEALAREGRLGRFAPSKPPGALAVYMAIDALAEIEPIAWLLAPLSEDAKRFPAVEPYANAAALSFLLMPLSTALLVFAVAFLAGQLFRDDRAGVGAALLLFTAPSVLLISYHLDGALYPLLAVLGSGLLAHAARSDRYWEAVVAGAVLALGIFISFSLIPAVGLALGGLALVAVERGREIGPAPALMRGGFNLAGAVAGALAVLFVLRVVWGFEVGVRYAGAMEHHAAWKVAVPTGLWRGMALVEFALYLGTPLCVVWLWRLLRAVAAITRRRVSSPEIALGFVLVLLVAVAVVAGTNEVARMWLFMVPFVAVAVAACTSRLARHEREWTASIVWLAGAQLAVALVMKGYQPW